MLASVQPPPLPSLRRVLHDHLTGTQVERPALNMHASDITSERAEYCPRAAVLRVRLGLPPATETVPTALAVTWEWGRLTEDRVRRWFSDLNMAVGDWRCAHAPCGRLHAWRLRPAACVCGGKAFDYVERRVVSRETGLSCGLDLILQRGRAKLCLVEIKSLDKDKYKDLAGALSEHKTRLQLYLRCIADSDLAAEIDTTQAEVLYVSKGGYGVAVHEPGLVEKFSPFKSFIVTRDDAAVESYWRKAAEARAAFLDPTRELPPRICPAAGVPRAQACSAATPCWAIL